MSNVALGDTFKMTFFTIDPPVFSRKIWVMDEITSKEITSANITFLEKNWVYINYVPEHKGLNKFRVKYELGDYQGIKKSYSTGVLEFNVK